LIFHNLHETCKISHDDLDGETTLKTKRSCLRIYKVLNHSTTIGNNMPNVHLLEGVTIRYEPPSSNYHSFNGEVTFQGIKSSLNYENFIPRGSFVKSPGFGLGIVVYVGNESRLMKNIQRPRMKSPLIEKEANKNLKFILLLHTALAMFCAIYDTIWFGLNEEKLPYIEDPNHEESLFKDFVITLGRWLLLIVEIPTSLVIHLELIRAYQAHQLQKHPLVQSEDGKKSNVIVNNDRVLEEIGRVQYLFLDKTYILTPNKWRVKEVVTGGQEYIFKPVKPVRAQSTFIYPNAQFDDVLSTKDHRNYEYLTLAICWSVVGLNIGKSSLTLADQAILDFASNSGFELKKRLDNDNDTFLLQCPKELKQITLLMTIEEDQGVNFLLKDQHTDKVILFCMGSIDYLYSYVENSVNQNVKAKIEDFTDAMFQTIFFAFTTLTDEQYNDLLDQFGNKNERQLFNIREFYKNLTLLCVAAVGESRHPDSQSIVEFMYKTGVNIWLLSGDDRATLVNSAYLTRIFPQESPHLALTSENLSTLQKEIEEKERDPRDYQQYYLLLSGNSLLQIENNAGLFTKFIVLASRCRGLIGYGILPRQKQSLVKGLKKIYSRKIILAIGKGPKDIPMMTEAHVSVGVQESFSLITADFIITKMNDLKVIMYIYGRETYRKNSILFQYIIYRGMYVALATFFSGINSRFTGNPLFSHFLLTFFEMMFSSIPITIYCLYDRKRSDEELLTNPELYHPARTNRYFNHTTFYLWKINGAIQGFWIWLFLCYFSSQNFVNSDGWTTSYWVIAHMAFWVNIVSVNFLLLVYASRISLALLFSAFLGCGLFLAFWAIESADLHTDSFYSFEASWRMPNLYLAFILVVVCSFIPLVIFQRYYKIVRGIKAKNLIE